VIVLVVVVDKTVVEVVVLVVPPEAITDRTVVVVLGALVVVVARVVVVSLIVSPPPVGGISGCGFGVVGIGSVPGLVTALGGAASSDRQPVVTKPKMLTIKISILIFRLDSFANSAESTIGSFGIF